MADFVLGVDLQVQRVLGLQNIRQQLAGLGGAGRAARTQGLQQGIINLGQASRQINRPLQTAATSVGVFGTRATKAADNVGEMSAATNKGARSAESFGDQVFLAAKRYGAFIAATSVAFKAVDLIGRGTEAVISFDQSLVRLRQVLGQTPQEIAGLRQQILDLSVATGTSAVEITELARTLAQAGFRDVRLAEAIEQIARVPLAPTFETIESAVEGSIAALNQFESEGLNTADVLDKLTAVGNSFAASSEDIAIGIARGGAAFEAIGGTLDEFIAAFTTIRQETREAASSVGVALKTISSRLASPEIRRFLEERGIRIIEEGQFVGPVEALTRIGERLQEITAVQDRVEIANRLGGRRQLSRLIALITNLDTFNASLETSRTSAGAFAEVTEEGLQAIQVRLNQLSAAAEELSIQLGPTLFVPFIEGLTNAAETAIDLIDALSPIIPLLAQIGTLFAGIGTVRGIRSLVGAGLARTGVAAAGGALATTAAARGFGPGAQRLAGAAGFVGQSPFAQAGLLVAAGQAASSLTELATGADSLTSSFISSFATITAAITLFRNQTLTQFAAGGGLFPSLGAVGGTLATIGAIAAPIVITQAREAVQENANRIIEASIESVNNINIDPEDITAENRSAIGDTLGELNNKLLQGIDEFTRAFDASDTTAELDERLTRAFASIGGQISGLFTGQFERFASELGISQADIENQVDRILQENENLITNIINSISRAIAVSDLDPSDEIIGGLFAQQAAEAGISVEATNILFERIVRAAGGVDQFNDKIRESSTVLDEQIRITENISRLTEALISPQLTGQLLLFGRAVENTTRILNTQADAFRAQIGVIRGITPAGVPTDFTDRSIREAVGGGAFGNIFDNLPEIPRFVLGIEEIRNTFGSFTRFLSDRGRDALEFGDLELELDRFLLARQEVPGNVRAGIRNILTEVGNLMAQSVGEDIPLGKIRDRFNEFLEQLGSEFSGSVTEQTRDLVDATLANVETNLDRFSELQQLRLAEPVTLQSQFEFLQNSLSELGITLSNLPQIRDLQARPGTIEDLVERARRTRRDITPEAPEGFFLGRAGAQIVEAAADIPARERLQQRFLELVESVAETRSQLAGLDFGTEEFTDVTQRFQRLNRELIRVQTSLESFSQVTQDARRLRLQEARQEGQLRLQRFREETAQLRARGAGFNVEARRRREFEITREIEDQERRINEEFDRLIEKDNELRTRAAEIIAESSATQQSATDIFRNSVQTFKDAVVQFSTFSQEGEAQQPLLEGFNRLFNLTDLPQEDALRLLDRAIQAQPAQANNENINQSRDALRNIPQSINNQTQSNQSQQSEISDKIEQGNQNNSAILMDIKDLMQRSEEIDQQIRDDLRQSREDVDRIIGQNTDGQNVQGIDELNQRLASLEQSLREPGSLRVSADQRVQVDVTGLGDEINDRVNTLLNEVGSEAAKSVVASALRSLADNADNETAISIERAISELA